MEWTSGEEFAVDKYASANVGRASHARRGRFLAKECVGSNRAGEERLHHPVATATEANPRSEHTQPRQSRLKTAGQTRSYRYASGNRCFPEHRLHDRCSGISLAKRHDLNVVTDNLAISSCRTSLSNKRLRRSRITDGFFGASVSMTDAWILR